MKKFDAVKMVREIRDKQYEETKGKTPEESARYYRERSKWALPPKAKQPIPAGKK